MFGMLTTIWTILTTLLKVVPLFFGALRWLYGPVASTVASHLTIADVKRVLVGFLVYLTLALTVISQVSTGAGQVFVAIGLAFATLAHAAARLYAEPATPTSTLTTMTESTPAGPS